MYPQAVVVSNIKPAIAIIIVVGVLLVVAIMAAFIAGYRRNQAEPPPSVSPGVGRDSWETPQEHVEHARQERRETREREKRSAHATGGRAPDERPPERPPS
jgi:hypothetical protein